jgi:hypothetical protein
LRVGCGYVDTSREKAIPGAPKWLIPGEFWFASDLYAGGNAYRWRILQFVGDNFFTAGAFGMCAGDNMLSEDKISENLKKFKKNRNFFQNILKL